MSNKSLLCSGEPGEGIRQLDIFNKIYGELVGAEIAVAIKNGKISVLYGNITRKMLDEIQMTCKIHGVKSGCVFLISDSHKFTLKTKGDVTRIEQPLKNVVNLW